MFHTAYQHIQARISHKETLYTAVVSAMVDFNDRFGKNFETYDALHESHIRDICDRILNQLPDKDLPTTEPMGSAPPAGFAREILDALDNAVRYRYSKN
jgi:hypothetical protein